MKRYLYRSTFVLIVASVLLTGCGLQTGGIPNPCWAKGICSNTYNSANGWNNCPAGWQVVFQAGESPNGDVGYASYGVTIPGSSDPVLGPDGQQEVVHPDPNNPASLLPIAYCIAPGSNPGWPYIPANGAACLPPAASYLQGSWSGCPDHNASNDCVCIPPGVARAVPSATPVPLPTLIFFHDEAAKYCVDPNKKLGAVVLSIPDSFNMTLTSGPNVLIKKQVDANGTSDLYTYIGPAGASFTLEQCVIPAGGTPSTPQTNPNLCTQYQETYGTCVSGVSGGGGTCKPPAAGCPSGTFWQGSPTCQCEGTK
ncbi:MAG TPA: hypothetical protein VLX61_17380 [Anaerolineales bacterium]|nr:hypothetical protein [Anaerolineales bacterium]